MASPHNLIDFSGEENNEIQPPKTATPTTDTASTNPVVVTSGLQNDKVNEATQAINAAKAAGKSNKSLFEITRVETRENAGGDADDSELDMDDTISEHNESSSTSVLDLITKQSQTESKEPSKEQERISTQLPDTSSPNTSSITNNINNDGPTPLVSNTALSQQETQVSQSQNLQQQQPTAQNNQAQNIHQPSQQNQSIEPPSRFRIVKIAKQKPYEKGNWMVNDFKDPQKQTESTSTEAPSSPAVKKRNPTSDSGTITSPTEPVKTKSSEFLTKALLVSHSRGSSYNTGDRRLSTESTSVSDSNSQTPGVTPIVEALESALEQIQVIKDSMMLNVSDEMKRVSDTLASVQVERNQLKEENEILKQKLKAAEERLSVLDKG